MAELFAAWARATELDPQAIMLGRFYYGDEGEFLGMGTKGMNFDGHSYKGLIDPKSIKIVNGAEISPVSAEIQTANASISINNAVDEAGERFSDELENEANGAGDDFGFEGRMIELRLINDRVTTWADSFLLAVGVMDILPDGQTSVTIKFSNEIDIILKKIEEYITDANAAIPSIGLPDDTLGSVKPYVQGDHQRKINIAFPAPDTDWSNTRANNLVKMISLGANADGDQLYMVAGRKIVGTPTRLEGNGVWAIESSLNRLVELDDWEVVSNTAEGCVIKRTGDTFFDYVQPISQSGTDWAIGDHMIDGDLSTSSTVSLAAGDPIGTQKDITFKFPEVLGTQGGLFLRYNNSGIDTYTQLLSDNVGIYDGVTDEDTFRQQVGVGATLDGNNEVSINYKKTGAGALITMRAFEVYFQGTFTDTAQMDLYWGGLGEPIGIAHNARGTAEGYTIDHADNNGEGGLAENPATVIEMLLRSPLSQDLVSDGELDSVGDWTGSGLVLISGGKANWSGAGTLEQVGILRKSHLTRISGEISNYSSGDVTPQAGSTGVGTELTGDGQFSEEIITAGSEDLIFDGGGLFSLDFAVASDSIDADSFNVSSNILSAYKLAPSITTVISSKKVLGQMALQSRSVLWRTGGKFTHQAIKDTYSDSDRDLLLDYDTIFNEDFERTKKNWIYPAVEVLYGLDASGKLTRSTGVSTNSAAQTRYRSNQTLKFKAPYIWDDATALLLQAYLLAQWKQPHNIHPFGVGLDGVQLKVGSIYGLKNAPPVRGKDITASYTLLGQTIYPYWIIYSVSRNQYGAQYKAMQLHRLDGS